VAGRGAIVVAAMSWGAIGPALALLPAGTPVMAVAASRIGLGAMGFLPLVARRPARVRDLWRPGTKGWLAAAVAANVVNHGTFMLGLALAGVAVGAMIHVGLLPVFTVLVERVVTGARLTLRSAVTTALAVGGSAALVLGEGARAGPHLVAGVIAAAVSSLGYSVFTVCSARVIRAGNCSTTVMAMVFSGTALGLSPLLFLVPVGWLLTLRGVAVLAFTGLVATSGAYCLYGFGLRHTPSSTAAVLVLAEPATAAVLAITVLGEDVGWLGAAGLATVFAALMTAAVPAEGAGLPGRRMGPRHARDRRPDAGPPGVVRLCPVAAPLSRVAPLGIPSVVEPVRFPIDTWRRIEAEATARGIAPRALIPHLVDVALTVHR
jgi:DME family drug/metabolite transporter